MGINGFMEQIKNILEKGKKMIEQEVSIIKVEQNKNGKIFIQTSKDPIDRILLLKAEDNDSVIVTFSNQEKLKIKYSELQRALKNDAYDLYKKHKNLDIFMQISNKDEDFVKSFNDTYAVDFDFSNLQNFKDITDNRFNNFNEINKSTITSQGLWAGNGNRLIELEYDAKEFLKCAENKASKLSLLLTKKNNDEIEPLEFDINKKENILNLNTDMFLDYLDEDEKDADFYGYIVVEINKDGYTFTQYTNFYIKIINPLYSMEDKDVVSIDFGTSSTCIALNKGKKLIAFTDNPETIDDYENQTSIIIFNWRKIYGEWGVKSRTIPHFNRSKNPSDNVEIKTEHYNYSNYIKTELQEAPSTKTMEAIISDLKTLPGKLDENPENKDSIKPFDDFRKKLFLTDNIDEEDNETLNPIALYAYLMGRSINIQIRNTIYTRYKLTMPVKFNARQKEALRSSIEYGLKRSVPLNIKDKIDVQIGFDESTALVGAAKKLKYFRFKDTNKEAFPFAVFDFGGGTLDFAFGIFRKSVKDDRAILNNENRYKDIVEIFKVDGMKLGGERLIEKLSYFLYKENKELMKENNISILVPDGEKNIEPFPANLFGNRHIDKINLKNINERISRDFFIFGESKNTTINVFSVDDDNIEKEITLELPQEKMEDFLNELVCDAVENFYKITKATFKSNIKRLEEFGFNEFDMNDIQIFQAGNTCRSKWVKNAFEEIFKEHPSIKFLEEKNAKDEFSKITVKNAVAKGALFLEGTGYYDYTTNKDGFMPLDRYIWNYEIIEDECEDAQPSLCTGDTIEHNFVWCSRIGDDFSFSVYYSNVGSVDDEDDDALEYHDIKIPQELQSKNISHVYIKPYDGRYVECAFGEDEESADNVAVAMVINLDTGDIEVKNNG